MVMREASGVDTMPGVRLMIYNIRYATGTGPAFHLPLPGAGYLRSSRQVLSQITDFIKRQARHQESTRWDTIEFKLD